MSNLKSRDVERCPKCGGSGKPPPMITRVAGMGMRTVPDVAAADIFQKGGSNERYPYHLL